MFRQLVKSKNQREMINNFVMFIILVIVSAFLVKFFWNRALVPHVTVLKPVKTLLDALLLSVGLNLLM
jgi:hypothetical protein